MPAISQKGQMMPESPIRKLAPYAEAAEAKGVKILQLNIGQPDIKTPKIAMDAVKNSNIDILSYSHSAGFLSYREKLAHYYSNQGIKVDSKDIIVTTGGSEALTFALNTIADQGDEIIIPEPFYANYNGFATASGLNVVPVYSSLENGFALPPIGEFEKLLTPKTKAIVICNPGNPTGYLYSHKEIRQLAALVLKHDIYIIADEVYREFAYDGLEHHSILKEHNIDDHAIMVDSVSKRFSMCGARIGCLVSRNKDFMKTAMKFAQVRLSPPTLAQIASAAALDVPQTYFDEIIAEYVDRRDTLVSGLAQIPGVKVSKPKGAFYCIAELPVKDAENFAKWLLADFSHNGKTIMVAPAAGFYSSPNVGLNQVRIAYVLKKEDLIEAIGLLKEALAQYKD